MDIIKPNRGPFVWWGGGIPEEEGVSNHIFAIFDPLPAFWGSQYKKNKSYAISSSHFVKSGRENECKSLWSVKIFWMGVKILQKKTHGKKKEKRQEGCFFSHPGSSLWSSVNTSNSHLLFASSPLWQCNLPKQSSISSHACIILQKN